MSKVVKSPVPNPRFDILIPPAESADFMFLMNETGLTRGNLSVQLGRLRDAGYITITKAFVGTTPRTTASMTSAGHSAFAEYRSYLEGLLDATS